MMANRRDLRTQFSKDAAEFADKFQMLLGHLKLPPADYTPELTTPAGPSTGGGVQALQHMRLRPRPESALSPIVFGSVNRKEGKAELRSYEHLQALHQQRFKRPLDLDQEEYSSFVLKAQRFLEASGLKASLAPLPGKIVLDDNEDDRGAAASGKGPLVFLLVTLALLAAGAFYAYVR
jgi:hypothetical protein